MNCSSFASCKGVPVSVAKSPQLHSAFLNSVWVIVSILLRLWHGQQDTSNFQGCQVISLYRLRQGRVSRTFCTTNLSRSAQSRTSGT